MKKCDDTRERSLIFLSEKTEADCSAKVIKKEIIKKKKTHLHTKKAFKTQKMIDTQTNKKKATTKIKNWRLVKDLLSLKKFTQKYLQVIELFKKTNLHTSRHKYKASFVLF